ncbi:hypothetical protein VPHK567_0300 [Vibrio phage K567]
MFKNFWYKLFGDPEWKVAGYTKQHRFSVTGSWGDTGKVTCRAVVLVNKHDERTIRIVYDEYDYTQSLSDTHHRLIDKIISVKKQNLIHSSMSTKKLNSYDDFDLCLHHNAFFDWESFNDDFIYGEVNLDGTLIEKSEAE